MSSPLSTAKNKYFQKRKNSKIYTPPKLAQRIFDIIKPSLEERLKTLKPFSLVIDTSIGKGSLIAPFKKHFGDKIVTVGFDTDPVGSSSGCHCFYQENFLADEVNRLIPSPEILCVIQNPPFNFEMEPVSKKSQSNDRKKLLCEQFTDAVFAYYGELVPLVSIQPMGFRLNQRVRSSRWRKYARSESKITSIMSLPLDTFSGVEFHAEVVFWNIPGLEAHYWYEDKPRYEPVDSKLISRNFF